MCSCAQYGDKTNCDDHIEGHDKFKEIKKSSVPLPTVKNLIYYDFFDFLHADFEAIISG